MEPDPSAAKPREPSAVLTVGLVAEICGSLEPAAMVSGFERVSRQLLGPATLAVYTLAPDDPARLVRFAEEGQGVKSGPLAFDPPPLRERAAGESGWKGRIPLVAGGENVGVLEASFDRSLDEADLAILSTLAQTLALAVRNGQTFERTRRLTFTDDLTALYNSRFMALYLDRELKRCRRTRSSLSLLFMDLDGFKAVNDTHGHLAGSRTLVEVGAILEKTVRDADVLIRYGGDEFVILFPETPLSGGLVIAERIRQVISGTRFLESMGLEAHVSASVGIAAYPDTAEDVRALIAGADQAMYQAKALGKDRVVAASPISTPQKGFST